MKFTFLADAPKDFQPDYPMPCHPLRFGYISRPELLGTPEMNRREQEDLVLSRLIIDRQLWNTTKEAVCQITSPPPSEDEFSKSLDKLTAEGVLSVALVFEARVFLDIQDIMGDEVERGHKDLLRTTTEIDRIMNMKVINGMWDVGGTGERWHERDADAVLRIKMTSMHWILNTPTNAFPKIKGQTISRLPPVDEDFFAPEPFSQHGRLPHRTDTPQSCDKGSLPTSMTKPPKNPKFSTVSTNIHRIPEGIDLRDPEAQRALRKQMVEAGALADDGPIDPIYEENARMWNIKMIQPSKDPNFLFVTNPVYCGLVSFNLLTDFEAAGINLCNWHKSIWPTAHLYNALQRTSSISKPWPEMEELINYHMEPLFASHLPLSAYEFYVRFALALGLSMSNFSQNPRNRTNNDRLRFRQGANGIKLSVTGISSVFRQYFDKKLSLEICLVKLDGLIRNPGSRASRKEKEASRRPLTTLQFLSMMESRLPQVTQRLQFDYITLTNQCVKLLKTMRQ